jgi:hypothetical protein
MTDENCADVANGYEHIPLLNMGDLAVQVVKRDHAATIQ